MERTKRNSIQQIIPSINRLRSTLMMRNTKLLALESNNGIRDLALLSVIRKIPKGPRVLHELIISIVQYLRLNQLTAALDSISTLGMTLPNTRPQQVKYTKATESLRLLKLIKALPRSSGLMLVIRTSLPIQVFLTLHTRASTNLKWKSSTGL